MLPVLAFTAGALALGTVVGVDRAALALTVAWSAGVVVPSLADGRLPAILHRRQPARVGAGHRGVDGRRARPGAGAGRTNRTRTFCTDDDVEPLPNGEIMMRTVSAAETAPSTYAWAVHAESCRSGPADTSRSTGST